MKTASNNRMFWEAAASLTGRGESSHLSQIKTSVDTMITAGNHRHKVLYNRLPTLPANHHNFLSAFQLCAFRFARAGKTQNDPVDVK